MSYEIKPVGKVYCIIDRTTKKMIESFKNLKDAIKYCENLVGGIMQK